MAGVVTGGAGVVGDHRRNGGNFGLELPDVILELLVGQDREALFVLPDGRLQLVFLLQRIALVAKLLRLRLPRCRVVILFELPLQRGDVAG